MMEAVTDVEVNDNVYTATDPTDVTCTEVSNQNGIEENVLKKRTPRRVLHFSDGTLEEYSTDEDEADNKIQKTTISEVNAVDPKTMTWGPWVWYKTVTASSKTLAACDYVGEKLASFFGITTPKYEYEIDFYETMKSEEEEKKKQQDLELGGWVASDGDSLQTTVPERNRNDEC